MASKSNATENTTNVSNEDESKKIDEENVTPTSSGKKKITIIVDEDDPCLKKDEEEIQKEYRIPGTDPRFQQQNQSLRCYVMYTDFFRCEHILGEGTEACTWFKDVYNSICPNEWIYQFDQLRVAGKYPWHKQRVQGNFPGHKYG